MTGEKGDGGEKVWEYNYCLQYIIIVVVTSFKSSVITCPFMANVTQCEP